jgi:hypothetical protein
LWQKEQNMTMNKIALIPTVALFATAAYSEPMHGPRRFDKMTPADIAALALSLQDYGMMRSEQDRNNFPQHMPRAGEPYDPITGNVLYPDSKTVK